MLRRVAGVTGEPFDCDRHAITAGRSHGNFRRRAAVPIERQSRFSQQAGLHMPGAISEMSPDSGCFLQAWSGYGVAWPVVTQMFGIQPDAFRRRLALSPTFPVGWTEARLSGVRVGSNTFDVAWDGRMLTVTSHEPGWTVTAGWHAP